MPFVDQIAAAAAQYAGVKATARAAQTRYFDRTLSGDALGEAVQNMIAVDAEIGAAKRHLQRLASHT
jgi:hypothetical protein